ncbi:MAG: ribbon-helix-helix protein, CopG family [Promethearchaeota archaeon]|nr:MAG: ribbon-helix-helix protein, CopG family [Candidatus Lokiarchaeota archaeon]
MLKNLSVRIKANILKELDSLADLLGVDRASIVRDVINKGIETKKIDIALELYQKGYTLEQAANTTKTSLWDLIDEVKKRGITSKSDIEQTKTLIVKLIARNDEQLAKKIREINLNI